MSHAAEAPATKPTGIKWMVNYEEALKQAKSGGKLILLLFTGSDWCTWCTKLEEEAFNSTDFYNLVGNKFVFVKLDFPLYSPQDAEIKVQNKQLQQKYDVRSFPLVVIYDPQTNQTIGTTGYRQGGGKQLAEYLNKMINDFAGYKQKVSSAEKTSLSGAELKTLYQQANKLGNKADARKIITMGVDSDQSLFFLMERYRQYASTGSIHSSEAITLRQQLMAADPQNERQIPFQLALIEFETFTSKVDPKTSSPELAVSPLNGYIEKFGAKDKDNTWRLHMIIAQVYLDNGQLQNALKHFQQASETAPHGAQSDIAKTIDAVSSKASTQSLLTLSER